MRTETYHKEELQFLYLPTVTVTVCSSRLGPSLQFIYLILFPYIPFRYIPWKWKTSHSIYIVRQLAHGITSIAKVEKYLQTTVITFLS